MLYVFSDGSVASDGTADNSADGRGKLIWKSDNSGTAGVFILVYDPVGVPQLVSPGRLSLFLIGRYLFYSARPEVRVAQLPSRHGAAQSASGAQSRTLVATSQFGWHGSLDVSIKQAPVAAHAQRWHTKSWSR